MTGGGQHSRLDPAILRERAEQCLRLADGLSGPDADTLKRIAIDYLEAAARLETAKLLQTAQLIEERKAGRA